MTDERPRPEYGEYATPQEQAEIIARSLPPVPPVLRPRDVDGAVAPVVPPAAQTPHAPHLPAPHRPAALLPGVGADRDGASPPGRRRWDHLVSLLLMTWGTLTVIAGFFQYSDIPAVLTQVYAQQGIGAYVGTGFATSAGLIINVSNVLILVATVYLTARRLRARKLAFWVPLVGGAVAGAITGVLLISLIVSDPTFQAYLTTRA
ncbi:MAG: hypothetical protein H7146_13685 [Burkholderiaceae bacterium]|nr:hypothetical protein [Microbacteriaceae bacterium]